MHVGITSASEEATQPDRRTLPMRKFLEEEDGRVLILHDPGAPDLVASLAGRNVTIRPVDGLGWVPEPGERWAAGTARRSRPGCPAPVRIVSSGHRAGQGGGLLAGRGESAGVPATEGGLARDHRPERPQGAGWLRHHHGSFRPAGLRAERADRAGSLRGAGAAPWEQRDLRGDRRPGAWLGRPRRTRAPWSWSRPKWQRTPSSTCHPDLVLIAPGGAGIVACRSITSSTAHPSVLVAEGAFGAPIDEVVINPRHFRRDWVEGVVDLRPVAPGRLALSTEDGELVLDGARGATERVVRRLRRAQGVRVAWPEDGVADHARVVAGLAMAGVPLVGPTGTRSGPPGPR